MQNWRKLKMRAGAVALAAFASSGVFASQAQGAEGNAPEFKFPVVLCHFAQWRLKNIDGRFDVLPDEYSPEYDFKVEKISALNQRGADGRMLRVTSGSFGGEYDIPDSAYHLSFDGSIEQGVEDGLTNLMRMHVYLQKRDPKTGAFSLVGQFSPSVPATAGPDGSVREDVPAIALNGIEAKPFLKRGKPDREKILAGLRDGKLEIGAVFSAGPVCGLFDGLTAKRLTKNREKYPEIFNRIVEPPKVEPAKTEAMIAETPADTRSDESGVTHESIQSPPADATQELAQQALEQQQRAEEAARVQDPRLAQQDGQPPLNEGMAPQMAKETSPQPMTPEQVELANQERLANAQAQAYNQLSDQSQYGGTADPALAAAGGQVLAPPQTPEQIQQQLSLIESQKQNLERAQYDLMVQQQQMAYEAELKAREAEAQQGQGVTPGEASGPAPASISGSPQAQASLASDFPPGGRGF